MLYIFLLQNSFSITSLGLQLLKFPSELSPLFTQVLFSLLVQLPVFFTDRLHKMINLYHVQRSNLNLFGIRILFPLGLNEFSDVIRCRFVVSYSNVLDQAVSTEGETATK